MIYNMRQTQFHLLNYKLNALQLVFEAYGRKTHSDSDDKLKFLQMLATKEEREEEKKVKL